MRKGPPERYFGREPDHLSTDKMCRVASLGRAGFYDGKHVDLRTRRYINERRYQRIVRDAADQIMANSNFFRN